MATTETQNREGLDKKRNGFTVPSGEKNWCGTKLVRAKI